MAEDNDRRAARFVVQGGERAPMRGADAEHVKEVSRDERALQPVALDPGVDLRRFANASENTAVSRMSVSYCGRVNVSGSALADR